MRHVRGLLSLVLIAGIAVLAPLAGAGPVAAQTAQAQVVSPVPAAFTPHAVDGRVFAFAEVGDMVVMGGSFTQVRSADQSVTYDLPYVVAFNRTTGAINTSFAPAVDKQVETLLPGKADNTVYIGGDFNNAGGVKAKGLIVVNVVSGARDLTFKLPPINGTVQRVRMAGGRLYVGGTFTTVGPETHGGLVAVDPTTGVIDPFVQTQVTVRHNDGVLNSIPAAVGIFNFAINPDGTRLVAVGNFKLVDGISRDQIVMLDLTTPQATVRADWHVRRFEAFCSLSDDTYVRDVDFSPDGTYIAVASVGGGHAGTLCDSASRFEATVTGDDIQPTWVDYSGADSVLSVAITGSVVYFGGHERWFNNPDGKDKANQGAVPRPGIAALDPATGVPLAWNPGRNPRGAGAYSLLATSTGLWVGSDTDYIGNRTYFHGKVAFFPLAGGSTLPALVTPHLPGGVYFGGQAGGSGLTRRSYDGTTAGPATAVAMGMDWSVVRGAFVLDDTLYYGKTDSKFYKRSLIGSRFGDEVAIDPYNDPYWSTVQSGSGVAPNDTYRGMVNGLYPKFPSVTSLFYDNKRVYYTLSGDTKLYYRAFVSDSGIIGGAKNSVAGVSMPAINGAFLDGGFLYYAASASGNLKRVPWVNGAPSGTAVTVSGPTKDGVDWRANALFVGPSTLLPAASMTATCSYLDCTVDASASNDQDGTLSYAWDFGDSTTDTGATPPVHHYTTMGTYTIGVTVTDNDGHTATASKSVFVQPVPTSKIAFRASAASNGNAASGTVTVPTSVKAGDGLVLIATTGSATSQTAPSGWTQVKSQAADPALTTIWQRVAQDGDAGSTVPVTFSATSKFDVHLLAYAGTAASNPVSATTAADTVTTASHTAPATSVTASGSWVVWYWADKSSTTTAWTAPADVTVRDTAIGTGTGYITAMVADTNAPQPIAAVPARTATTDAAAAKATMASIVLAPAPSLPPVAAATVDCTGLHCSVDGTGSSDPDGTLTSYSWNFGDGTDVVSGSTATHDYTTAGTYTVTLTVTDDTGMTATRTKSVTVAPVPTSNIAFRAFSAFNGASATPTVAVPASVQTGDALVLIATSASATTQTAPAGWTLVGSKTAGTSTVMTTIWQRVAQDGDAGTPVAVTLSGSSKVDVHLLAYSGTAPSSPVTAVLSADTTTTASHTTPATSVATSGSWVLSYWSDKSSTTTAWTAPSGVITRDSAIGSGTAYVTTLIADNGVPLATGPVAGATATTDVAAAKAIMASIVLAPSP